MDEKRYRKVLKRGKRERYCPPEAYLSGWYTGEEVQAAVEAIRKGMDWRVGFLTYGPEHRREILDLEAAFAGYIGTEYCVAINGAGTGLDMAIMCLDLEPGGEVIMPAINFRAEAMCVIGQGGQVVWCEVDPRTLQADPEDVERRITPRTRAILPVHMNGLTAPMDDLLDIAERHPHPKHGPLKVIGDAARACGGKYHGERIGKKGWMTVFSFHAMKLMTTLGEGGAITTDDPALAERLIAHREFGRGGKYWGSNYKMTCVQAAVGLVQLRRLDEMIALRRQRALERNEMLQDVPELTLPHEPPDCMHTYYLYTCLVPEEWAGENRDLLIKIMCEEYNIGVGVHNKPGYVENPFIARHTKGQRLPRSEMLGNRIITVSLHPLMTPEENEYIAAALSEVVARLRKM